MNDGDGVVKCIANLREAIDSICDHYTLGQESLYADEDKNIFVEGPDKFIPIEVTKDYSKKNKIEKVSKKQKPAKIKKRRHSSREASLKCRDMITLMVKSDVVALRSHQRSLVSFFQHFFLYSSVEDKH